jgi:hypothetical protein
MRKLFVLAFLSAISATAVGADATTAWKKVLKKCARSDLIGSQQLFFGLSNTAGPGSVWSYADDKSIRLDWLLSDGIPDDRARGNLVLAGLPVSCSGASETKWNLKLGLPFSAGSAPVSADVAAVLGTARQVTVSVTSFTIDALKVGPWRDALPTIPATNSYRNVLNQPGAVIAMNGVKVSGLKAVFTFEGQLSAEVQAKFNKKAFTLGATPLPGTGTSSAATTGGTPGAPAGSPGGTQPAQSASTSSDTCSTSAVATTPTAGSNPATTTMTGGATISTEVVGGNQIIVCAMGSPYMLAAYSKVKSGGTLAVAPSNAILLAKASIPSSTVVRASTR